MPRGSLRMHLRNRIAYYRERRGFSQAELASLLRLPRGTLSSWEMDRGRPSLADLDGLCRYLKCTPEDLFIHPDRR